VAITQAHKRSRLHFKRGVRQATPGRRSHPQWQTLARGPTFPTDRDELDASGDPHELRENRGASRCVLLLTPPNYKELKMTTFPSLAHVALTVRDLTVSTAWYEALFDAAPVIDEDTDPDLHHTVYLIGNGTLIGLHQHKRPAPDGMFNEFKVGLDHVAFGCADRAELEKWALRLDELGITHGGIKDATYGSGVSFRDPDGIALEFFAPPS